MEYEERIVRLNEAFNKKWQSNWDAIAEKFPNNHLRKIKATIGPWPHTLLKNRPLDVILTRFRLGHTRLNKHLYKMKMSNTPNCQKCDVGCAESISHFIMDCVYYTSNRQILIRNLEQMGIINPTLAILLGQSTLEDNKKIKITNELACFIQRSQRMDDL